MAEGKLAGQVVVVTGAGSGIGRASALALAAEGASIALAGRRREPLEAVAAEVTRAGGEALVVPTDVANPAEVDALFAAVVARWGRIDLLFNNAGVSAPGIPKISRTAARIEVC